jgi:hypothetical protein
VYSKESDVCLIVKDLEKGWKVDHEPTAQHYKELLESHDITYITEVFCFLNMLSYKYSYMLMSIFEIDHASQTIES